MRPPKVTSLPPESPPGPTRSIATLKRFSTVVHLQRHAAVSPDDSERPSPVHFSDLEEAERYLRFWISDRAAMDRLRRALHDSDHSGMVAHRTDHEVTRALAARLVSRSLVLVEEGTLHKPMAVTWKVVSAEVEPEPPPAAKVVRPKKPVVTVPEVPLLPLLEEVQIEGARVLPEVLQTLEQVESTMDNLDLANLSLEPTPSGVPPINESMSKASDDITATIDGL